MAEMYGSIAIGCRQPKTPYSRVAGTHSRLLSPGPAQERKFTNVLRKMFLQLDPYTVVRNNKLHIEKSTADGLPHSYSPEHREPKKANYFGSQTPVFTPKPKTPKSIPGAYDVYDWSDSDDEEEAKQVKTPAAVSISESYSDNGDSTTEVYRVYDNRGGYASDVGGQQQNIYNDHDHDHDDYYEDDGYNDDHCDRQDDHLEHQNVRDDDGEDDFYADE